MANNSRVSALRESLDSLVFPGFSGTKFPGYYNKNDDFINNYIVFQLIFRTTFFKIVLGNYFLDHLPRYLQAIPHWTFFTKFAYFFAILIKMSEIFFEILKKKQIFFSYQRVPPLLKFRFQN